MLRRLHDKLRHSSELRRQRNCLAWQRSRNLTKQASSQMQERLREMVERNRHLSEYNLALILLLSQSGDRVASRVGGSTVASVAPHTDCARDGVQVAPAIADGHASQRYGASQRELGAAYFQTGEANDTAADAEVAAVNAAALAGPGSRGGGSACAGAATRSHSQAGCVSSPARLRPLTRAHSQATPPDTPSIGTPEPAGTRATRGRGRHALRVMSKEGKAKGGELCGDRAGALLPAKRAPSDEGVCETLPRHSRKHAATALLPPLPTLAPAASAETASGAFDTLGTTAPEGPHHGPHHEALTALSAVFDAQEALERAASAAMEIVPHAQLAAAYTSMSAVTAVASATDAFRAVVASATDAAQAAMSTADAGPFPLSASTTVSAAHSTAMHGSRAHACSHARFPLEVELPPSPSLLTATMATPITASAPPPHLTANMATPTTASAPNAGHPPHRTLLAVHGAITELRRPRDAPDRAVMDDGDGDAGGVRAGADGPPLDEDSLLAISDMMDVWKDATFALDVSSYLCMEDGV